MPSPRALCLPVFLLLAAAFFAACDRDEVAPDVSITEVDYNCGRPEVTFAIDRNDEMITDLIVNWGRNHVAMNPPSLYVSDPVGPAFGENDDWHIRNTGGVDVSLPLGDDLDVFLRFDFATPLDINEKLVMNLQAQYERAGEPTQSVFSERVTVPFDSTAAAECATSGGGPGNPPVVDTNPATCPDTTNFATGGLAIPVVDPLMVDGPLDGADEVGQIVGAFASVSFKWQEVEGHAETTKGYQVEAVRAGQPSCISLWDPEAPAQLEGDEATCFFLDTNAEGTGLLLLPDSAYTWRVRASCTMPDDTLLPGPFTPFMNFTTAGAPE